MRIVRIALALLALALLGAPARAGNGAPDLKGFRKTCYGGPAKTKRAPAALRASVKRWKERGLLLVAEAKYADGARELQRALQIGGDDEGALRGMATALANTDRPDRARACAALLDSLTAKPK